MRSSTVRALPEVIPSETTGSPSEPETSFGGNPALSCALQEGRDASSTGGNRAWVRKEGSEEGREARVLRSGCERDKVTAGSIDRRKGTLHVC